MLHPTTRRRRLAVTIVGLVTVFGVAATACGDDKVDSSAKKSTTSTTSKDSSKSTTTGASGDTVPVAEGVAKVRAEIDAGKGDVCKIYAAANGTSGIDQPKSGDETKAAVGLFVYAFNAIADAAPADQQAAADSIRAGATKLEQLAADKNYDASVLQSTEFADAAFQSAFQTIAGKCAPAQPQDSSVPSTTTP